MKLYYIIRSDGSSVFEQGFQLDFILHCYLHLIERSSETFQVISFSESSAIAPFRRSGVKGTSPLYLPLHCNILKYIDCLPLYQTSPFD